MVQIHKLFLLVLAVNAILLIVFYVGSSPYSDLKAAELETNQNLVAKETRSKQSDQLHIAADVLEGEVKLRMISEFLKEAQNELASLEGLRNIASKRKTTKSKKVKKGKSAIYPNTPLKSLAKRNNPFGTFAREDNPFNIIGAYPEVEIQVPYENRLEVPTYDKVLYGYINDDDYCERVDYYNLAHPENIFENKVFFTDYSRGTIPREDIIPSIGRNSIKDLHKGRKEGIEKRRLYHFDLDINTFFINMDGFQVYHEIGKHFLCATQMFNHIPGQRALIRKDDLVEAISVYAAKYKSKPECFNKKMFFPYSHRLFREDECNGFFDLINDQKFLKSLEDEPIQFILKIGHGSHSAHGVSLMDKEEMDRLNSDYNYGKLCGTKSEPLIAQDYVTNPLLLDLGNKFDFRIYMLIASTDPLIVYYHDGFLRATLSAYDKFSHERGKHLTNTHIASQMFKEAQDKKINGMTEQELRDYHVWSFEELEEYLLESGKITDPDWLNNHLRPQFRKAMIHIVRMTSEFFLKRNNIYGLYGLDFMLDTDFNLWFIEANPNPQLMATSEFLGDLLNKLLRSLFDIEYGLYKSRMLRTLKIVKRMQSEKKNGNVDYTKYQEEYKTAGKNRFESEYKIGKNNTFTLIMDEGLSGSKAYFDNISEDCASF